LLSYTKGSWPTVHRRNEGIAVIHVVDEIFAQGEPGANPSGIEHARHSAGAATAAARSTMLHDQRQSLFVYAGTVAERKGLHFSLRFAATFNVDGNRSRFGRRSAGATNRTPESHRAPFFFVSTGMSAHLARARRKFPATGDSPRRTRARRTMPRSRRPSSSRRCSSSCCTMLPGRSWRSRRSSSQPQVCVVVLQVGPAGLPAQSAFVTHSTTTQSPVVVLHTTGESLTQSALVVHLGWHWPEQTSLA
jgi:hypothetical protein